MENLRYTNDPNDLYGKLILSVLGSFAEFERSLIRQRQLEGIEAAKKKGVYTGRKRALSPSEIVDLQKKAAAKKAVKSKIAREYGITRETLYQYLKLEVKIDGLAEEDALGLTGGG
jgi:DNA invertase Pin-like site-specific DNA recombinase